MVIDNTVSVEGIYAFIYCTKWRSGQVSHSLTDLLTHSQTLKDRATQLLIKYKSNATGGQDKLCAINAGSYLEDHTYNDVNFDRSCIGVVSIQPI